MAIQFLGYIDNMDEELPRGCRRCLFGCDSDADWEDLPVGETFTLPSGAATSKSAPWSVALTPGEKPLVLVGETWSEY